MIPAPDGASEARPGLRAFVAVLVVRCLVLACGPAAGKARRPNLIIHLLDTIRADHVGAYG